jgi:hypothetical protein
LFWARARLCWLGSHRVPGSNLWQCGLVLDIRSRHWFGHWFGLCFGSRFWPSFRTWVRPCFWCRCGINDRFWPWPWPWLRFWFWFRFWFRCGINDRLGFRFRFRFWLWLWFRLWFRLWFFTDDGSWVNAQ